MYRMTDETGKCFLTITGVPVTDNTCLLYMVRYGDIPDDFDYDTIFQCVREDGFSHVLVVAPSGIDVPGWDKVGQFPGGVMWNLEVMSDE